MRKIETKKGLKHVLSGSITGRAINFLINIGLTRTLGASNLGVFGLVLATSQTFEITTRVGIDYGMQCMLTDTECASELSTKKEQIIIKSALRWVEVTTLFFGLILLIWLVMFKGLLPQELEISRQLTAILVLIICSVESLGGLPWDVFLVTGKTRLLALRTGLFVPSKLTAALIGAWLWGLKGSLMGYTIACAAQTLWLRRELGIRWPGTEKTELVSWVHILSMVKLGLPLYITNAISSLLFLPLLANLAVNANLEDVGYIRVGQIIVQIFTLLPGALAPLLFVKLRQTTDIKAGHKHSEASLMYIWTIGILLLLAYLAVDRQLVIAFFGRDFLPSLSATRLLALAAILDAVSQVLHTSLLAKEKTGLFTVTQNTSAIAAGIIGWKLIPSLGLTGFLAAKLTYSWLPVLVYITEAWSRLNNKQLIGMLLLTTILATIICWGSSPINSYLWLVCALMTLISILKIANHYNIFEVT